jgi:hypothetical protein
LYSCFLMYPYPTACNLVPEYQDPNHISDRAFCISKNLKEGYMHINKTAFTY